MAFSEGDFLIQFEVIERFSIDCRYTKVDLLIFWCLWHAQRKRFIRIHLRFWGSIVEVALISGLSHEVSCLIQRIAAAIPMLALPTRHLA